MAGKRTRTQQDAVNRSRLNGTSIKKGLDELRDLDAKPQPVHTVPSERSCEGNAMRGKAVASRQGAAEKKRKTEVASAADGSTATKRNEKNPSVVPETIINTANSTKHCGNSSPCVFGYSWEEWKSVKRHLFDTTDKKGTAEARRRALDHVELVWTARSRHGRPLPSYVESTSLLLEVVSLDECGQLSSTAITALYGAVISRTVHLMTGTFARGDDDTYRKRAQAIEFPEEAVEVRQRVAHGALPLLSELRWVCGLVLQFLFHNYWQEQERHVRLMEQEVHEKDEEDGKEVVVESKTLTVGGNAPHHTTIEEMRKLLQELSDDGAEEEEEGGKVNTASHDSTEMGQANDPSDSETLCVGGWKLS